MAFVPPYCPNIATVYTSRSASTAEREKIWKACQDLDLPLDTIDFQSSRVQNAENTPIEVRGEHIPSRWKQVFEENKLVEASHHVASGRLNYGSVRYVPLLVEVDEGDSTADVISKRRKLWKDEFVKAKAGRTNTTPFVFPRYFKVPDRQNEVLALLTNQPEHSLIDSLELPSAIEPLLVRTDVLGPADNTKRSAH